ncbi:hypothetical protein LOK49_LG02G03204 [Camellia lanceoleosa]|uniref:Uncharacterized protein n=1 Tax=Camellia lanceoleosa TaxID=1840588 RepID=A0ACC0IK48_9ERIC|nr:hypothetical protein LOK49_LG02G03204 [Camellia lanceoleosa]
MTPSVVISQSSLASRCSTTAKGYPQTRVDIVVSRNPSAVSECSPADNTGRAAALTVFGFLQGFQAWELQDGIACANAEGGLGQAADISKYGYQELTTPWNSYIHYLVNETELRGAEHHPAKRPRKVAQHWCKNAQEMIESMQRLQAEADGLGQWMIVARALLGKHVEEKIQEFIPTARFFRGSKTITARNKGKYLMDDELSNGNHQRWQPLASVTNQYRQPPPLNSSKVVTTAVRPCPTSPAVRDRDASLNGQLGQTVRNGTKFPSHMEISTQNSCNWELRGPPLTMGQTQFSQIQHQDGYNWQLFDEPESLQATQLGYFQKYGGDAPQSAVYRHGVGPSLASQALTMAEITQQVWEKLMQEQASMIVQNTQQICEKLKRELRAELTTHIEQMTN